MKLNLHVTRTQILNFFPNLTPDSVAWEVLNDLVSAKEDLEKKTTEGTVSVRPDLTDLVRLVRSFHNYRYENKIAAIKAVRETGKRMGLDIGLADAKNFVEQV